MYNVPALDEAVAEWSDPVKLSDAMGDSHFRCGSRIPGSFFGQLVMLCLFSSKIISRLPRGREPRRINARRTPGSDIETPPWPPYNCETYPTLLFSSSLSRVTWVDRAINLSTIYSSFHFGLGIAATTVVAWVSFFSRKCICLVARFLWLDVWFFVAKQNTYVHTVIGFVGLLRQPANN